MLLVISCYIKQQTQLCRSDILVLYSVLLHVSAVCISFCTLPVILHWCAQTDTALVCTDWYCTGVQRLVLHWCAQTAKAFSLFILSTVSIFFLVSSYLTLQFTFNPIHWIIPKKSVIQYLTFWCVYRVSCTVYCPDRDQPRGVVVRVSNHEVPGSILRSTVGIFPGRRRSPWWPWSG